MNALRDVFGTSWKQNRAVLEKIARGGTLPVQRPHAGVNSRRLFQRRPAKCITSVPPPIMQTLKKSRTQANQPKIKAPVLGVKAKKAAPKTGQPIMGGGLTAHVGMGGGLMNAPSTVPPVTSTATAATMDTTISSATVQPPMEDTDALTQEEDDTPTDTKPTKKKKKKMIDTKAFFGHMREAKGQYRHIHPVADGYLTMAKKRQKNGPDLGLTTDREQFRRDVVQVIEARAREIARKKHFPKNLGARSILQSKQVKYRPLPDLTDQEDSVIEYDPLDATFSRSFEILREELCFQNLKTHIPAPYLRPDLPPPPTVQEREATKAKAPPPRENYLTNAQIQKQDDDYWAAYYEQHPEEVEEEEPEPAAMNQTFVPLHQPVGMSSTFQATSTFSSTLKSANQPMAAAKLVQPTMLATHFRADQSGSGQPHWHYQGSPTTAPTQYSPTTTSSPNYSNTTHHNVQQLSSPSPTRPKKKHRLPALQQRQTKQGRQQQPTNDLSATYPEPQRSAVDDFLLGVARANQEMVL
eukprot:TRINITY_DN67467_c3_g2_i1.p1 TRINITY_DN67467_c3_g2~~TRINITY_DN67467_c3_g2_i1.p1  ORF type:complete len:588 (-),score=74.84 TRINITY_DN67467_c3_g2_i1:214-1785(-)